MREHSYTKDDLKQILQGASLPPVSLPKKEPQIEPEPAKTAPSTFFRKEEIFKLLNEKQNSALDTSQKILKKWPLFARNLRARQKEEKSHNSEPLEQLKAENERCNNTIKELTQALAHHRSLDRSTTKKKEEQTLVFDELKIANHHLEQELAEHKTRLMRFVCERKELEDKLALAHKEKTTLLAKLREVSSKNTEQSDLAHKFQQKTYEMDALLAEKEASLETLQKAFSENRTAFEEQLAVSQACLLEKQQALEEEKKKYRLLKEESDQKSKKFEETEAHAKQLEQHLARRIKECALFLKQVEELTATNSKEQKQLASIETSYQQIQAELDAAQQARKQLEQQYEALFVSWQQQEQEIALLRREKERLAQLEQIFGQCEKIFLKDEA